MYTVLHCWPLVIIIIFMQYTGSMGRQCSWSNEGCYNNTDCCSKDCVKKHQGTNPRCERSTISEPCYENYHCEEGLTCGQTYTCCSPYWGICMETSDCCDAAHVCRHVEWVTYKRCLYPSASISHRSKYHLLFAVFVILYYI